MASDILTRPAPPPDQTLRYGDRDDQVAGLRRPVSDPSAPVVVFLHGGFWRSAFDVRHTGPLATALAAAGFVVCTPEFRRTGQPGGGWPGTFDDIALALSVLPGLIGSSGPVVVGGHSAGGHLALWAARGLPVAGVVSLAGVCDLAACYRLGLGSGAAGELMGGGPDEVPDRYSAADPMGLVPTGALVRLVHGTADDRVPDELSRSYAARPEAAGDDVRCELLPGVGHFELIDPLSGAWAAVLGAFWSAAGGAERG